MNCNFCLQAREDLRWEMLAPRQWELVCEICCPLLQDGYGIPPWTLDDALEWLQVRIPESLPIMKKLYGLLKDSERLEGTKVSSYGSYTQELIARVQDDQMSFLWQETWGLSSSPVILGDILPLKRDTGIGKTPTSRDITRQFYSAKQALRVSGVVT